MTKFFNWVADEGVDQADHNGDYGVSLEINRPIGQVAGFALLYLVLGIAFFECVARIAYFQNTSLPPSIGSSHRQLEIKIAYLDSLVHKHGSVDCVFLGSSGVARAVDPKVIHEVYREKSRGSIKCFNFGLQALTPEVARQIAEIILNEYHPNLLVYGVEVLVFVDLPDERRTNVEASLLDSPWVQQKLGNQSIQGFLIEHSYALRYYLLVRNWMMRDFFSETYPQMERGGYVDIHGYREKTAEGIDVSVKADVREKPIYRTIPGFQISQRQLDGLNKLTSLQNQTTVTIFEVPLHSSLMELFNSNEEEYKQHLMKIRAVVERRDVPFWQLSGTYKIHDEMWLDRNHLNHDGAQFFSRWLGEMIIQAESQGEVNLQ